jgi:hypothetical protein
MKKTDLDKLLDGEPIYRHEDLRAIEQKWNGWADFLQFSSIAGLFIMIFILEAVGKETAKQIVWYLAGFLFLYATVAFIVGMKALKHRMTYWNAESARVGTLLDDSITKVKKGKK